MLRPQLLKLSVEAPVMKNLNVLFKKSLLSVMMLNVNEPIKPLRKNESKPLQGILKISKNSSKMNAP
jgi:hypothetical protein